MPNIQHVVVHIIIVQLFMEFLEYRRCTIVQSNLELVSMKVTLKYILEKAFPMTEFPFLLVLILITVFYISLW